MIINEYKTFSSIAEFQEEWHCGTFQNWFFTFDEQAFSGKYSNLVVSETKISKWSKSI